MHMGNVERRSKLGMQYLVFGGAGGTDVDTDGQVLAAQAVLGERIDILELGFSILDFNGGTAPTFGLSAWYKSGLPDGVHIAATAMVTTLLKATATTAAAPVTRIEEYPVATYQPVLYESAESTYDDGSIANIGAILLRAELTGSPTDVGNVIAWVGYKVYRGFEAR